MGLFVDQTELFEIKFYVSTDEKGVNKISSSQEDSNSIEYSMFFRKPAYGDNVKILNASLKASSNGEIQINPVLARYERFCTLLVKWTLKDKNGKDVEVTCENIDNLDTDIANFVVDELEKVLS